MGVANEAKSVFDPFHVLMSFVLVCVTDSIEGNKKSVTGFWF